MLLDEVEDRVANGISARGIEGARLMQGFQMSFPHQRRLLHSTERKYGAIFVAAGYEHIAGMPWRHEEDGWVPGPTVEELNLPFTSREDICKAFATYHVRYTITACNPMEFCSLAAGLVSEVKADAVFLMVDRGCKGWVTGTLEVGNFLRSQGIPTMLFEGSQLDPRALDVEKVLERMDVFVRSLGYSPLDGE